MDKTEFSLRFSRYGRSVGFEDAAGKPESAVYVGDSFSADYEGALAAGLHPLLIDPERRHPVPDAHRIASVSETLARVEAWA